ncbi:UNVERIFIED_CONTAM: hypothetical protein GTU68_009196, partial [Idotea baltica]|nr:hypothetical protein [Idotea baltica]
MSTSSAIRCSSRYRKWATPPFSSGTSPRNSGASRKNMVILKGKLFSFGVSSVELPSPRSDGSRRAEAFPATELLRNITERLSSSDTPISRRFGHLRVRATMEWDAQSYTIVKVEAIPYFTTEPEIQNKAEDEVAIFKCAASGKPEPRIEWIYNGRPIEQAAKKWNREVASDMIKIFNLTAQDTGNYGCNATNDHGYVYKDVYVNVLALAPEIRVAPSDVQTVDGKNVNMTCRVFGAPKPRISWFRDNQELTGGRYNITEDGDLIIHDVSFPDRGDYTCTAVNRFGSQTSNGSLEVKRRTKITDTPQDYEVVAGSTATFRCNAVSDPSLELNIDWMIDDKKMDFEQEPRFVKQSDNSLSITKTTELDSGMYTCVASTDLDEATSSANLIVQDVPNSPQLRSIECHDKDVSITWQPMGDNRAHILGYTIQYNTSFTPDTWEDAFTDFPATSTQVTVDMSPWSNYTFRVIARNKIGASLPSGHSQVCTTPEDVPHKNPDGVQGKGSTANNLVIRWSPMPEIEHNGPGFKYRVYYKRDDIPGDPWKAEEVVDWERDHFVIE